MAASLTILVGPARSGKTYRLLDEYRRVLAGGLSGCALWLGPNRASVEAIQSALLGPDLPYCSRPQCHTFGRFAQAVLDASPAPLRPASELMKRQILRELIERGIAEGEIRYFAPIADTPGLMQLVSATIREWKRLEIWPEDLATACHQVGVTQKDAELLWIYTEYQSLLNRHELYDNQGRFWSARARLKDGQTQPFQNVHYVFVDGFTDFTRTEHEVLSILAERAESIQISLPGEVAAGNIPQAERSELFAKPLRTIAELKRRHPRAIISTTERRATDFPAMDFVEARLFGPPGSKLPVEKSAGIEIIAAAGRVQEIESIARRIKLLLTASSPAIRNTDVLVIIRSLSESTELVREVFDRYGIPIELDSSPSLAAATCVTSCVAWLRLEIEDWPFRQLLSMVSHNSLSPDWGEWQHGRAAIEAEYLIRELQIPQGKAELLERIERGAKPLADKAPPEPGSHAERRFHRARLALPFLTRLAYFTSVWPQVATATDWTRHLTQFANESGLGKLISGSPVEQAAWDKLMEQLRSIDRLNRWLTASPTSSAKAPSSRRRLTGNTVVAGGISRAELLELIAEIADCESLPAVSRIVGGVRVVSATTARSLSAPYVFVAGLTEKSFPAAEREDRLYGEAETSQLVSAGLPLPTRSERAQEEMLLFYEVVTRATRQLVLSYPGLDDKAQPLARSPYLAELERACGAGTIPHIREEELSPIPRDREVLSLRELRIRATADAIDKDGSLLAGLFASNRPELTSPANCIKRSLSTLHTRSRGESFGEFEGVLTGNAAVNALTARFGPEHCWSASQLERYAYCPFQYFASRVLAIEPLGELSLEIDHLLRGNLLHGTLTDLHRKLNADAGVPVSPLLQTAASFERAAMEVLDALLQTISSENPIVQSLREIDRRLLSQWLVNYYEQHQHYDEQWQQLEGPFRPTHFEVPFGPDHQPGDYQDVQVSRDVLGTSEPLEVRVGDEAVRIGGRIDRVDLGKIAGQPVFHVIDYKSASSFKITQEMVSAGERLQLPLYALALEQLLLSGIGALPWRASYWLVKEKGLRHRGFLEFHQLIDGRIEPTEAWLAIKKDLHQIIFKLVRGIRSGQFPMHCNDETCTSRCEYRTVCRVGQVRSLEKSWPLKTAPEGAVPESGETEAGAQEEPGKFAKSDSSIPRPVSKRRRKQ